MSAPGGRKIITGDATTASGKKIETLLPENADHEKPVECLNDVTFTDRAAIVQVYKNFLVEGDLVVHGSLTVHGFSEFQGTARASFEKKYSQGPMHVINDSAQGNPTVYPQKIEARGDTYIYREGLSCLNDDKTVIINGDLVVTGDFTARGAARFHKKASFDGGVAFATDPLGEEE
ncbi:hypothetical protein FKW77_009333 [Venturia effusa]|uniref:Uncharacterized protein n=1 Tax=Venturia effusa TaxID=50376 RepID=A0A517LCY8_9PEZI|nr:hypothetical protein FKW77_009333 [Venturia effusa]